MIGLTAFFLEYNNGVRMGVRTLFDHLIAGDSMQLFLEDFPTVSREMAVAALEMGLSALEARAEVIEPAHR